MPTIRAFAEALHLQFSAVRIEARPDSSGDAWNDTATHWLCTIKHQAVRKNDPRKPLVCYFSQGSGIKARNGGPVPPRIDEILDSLLCDAESWESAGTVDEFAREMGMDEPQEPRHGRKPEGLIARARRVQETFDACGQAHRKLLAFFGPEGFAELRACERL